MYRNILQCLLGKKEIVFLIIRSIMKTTKLILKVIALALAVSMILPFVTSCSGKTVMSFTADNGKTYTISESQLEFLMMYTKAQALMNLGVSTTYDTADALWNVSYDDTLTYDAYYTQFVFDTLKSMLVEQYLFEKFNLSYDEETLASRKKTLKEAVKDRGGIGAYKQYWGYTDAQMLDYYYAQLRAEAIQEYLYGENGVEKVTDEDKENFYNDNYVGYQIILLDMKNKVVVDEEGNKKRKTTTTEGEVVEQNSYETEALTDEEVEEKALLPKLILDKLEAGEDFWSLAKLYSDTYVTEQYPYGVFVLKDSSPVNDATVTEAVKKLEVGQHTEALSVSEGAYTYIIKRIPLYEKVYEDDLYAELFKSYDDTVKYDKYEKYLEGYVEIIVVPENLATKYSMANTYTTPYVDYYYAYMQQYSSLYGN